ncbi:MAG: methyl-accepting chemotaxis protein [Ancalomicrobiaceae bacterium]|nr:methyl-accepting chemotaxis protein [Ancalomicrobiaceae bacterium]
MSLNRLSLRSKIALIVALMLIPISILTYQFVTQAQKTVVATRLELNGIEYSMAVWNATQSVSIAAADGTTVPATTMRPLPDMVALGARYDQAFDAVAKARVFNDKLAALGWPNQPVPRSTDVAPILDAAKDLLSTISDGSGMTLESQIDAFYLGRALTSYQPAMLSAAGQAMAAAANLESKQMVSPGDLARLLTNFNEFRKAAKDVDGRYVAALTANKSGELKALLEADANAERDACNRFYDEAMKLADYIEKNGSLQGYSIANFAAARTMAGSVNRTLWKNGANAMQTLLDERIAATNANTLMMLGIAAGVLIAALGLAIYIGWNTTRSFARMIETMDKVRKNDFTVVVEGTTRSDEVGQIARAVEVFKENGLKVAELTANYRGQVDAIRRAQVVAEFTLDGIVLDANEAYCTLMGYTLSEVVGEHHSAHVDPVYRQTPEYRMFWEKLGRGEHISGQSKRVGRGGKEVWVQGTYNPILGLDGKPYKVVAYATDVTAQVLAAKALEKAVKETQDVVAAAKGNDLSLRVPIEGKTGEIAELCVGINGLLDTMTTVISEMLSASSTISSAVAEITTGTNDLSERTEKQASSLEETSSSMEEIATTIRQNAENAQQANQLAINARSVASEGGQVVARAVDAMSKIESSSRKISDIIGVIDEIAFQTNLLALNAAVEAARAGDAGRGFAVVASEVRSLAQRSSEAAKDIKALIVESGGQVKDGVTLVNDAGSSLQQIVDSVKRVTDIVSEIAAASKEQAIGVEEINKAVAQMDEMTQQNSALVEENAAACRMLQQQAEEMNERMSTFDVGDARYDTPAKAPVELKSRRQPPQTQTHQQRDSRPAAKPPVKKIASARGPQRMQSELKAAFETDADWKEF